MEYMHVGIIDFAHNVNERVFGIFLAQDVDVRVQNDGKTKYITLTMVDSTFYDFECFLHPIRPLNKIGWTLVKYIKVVGNG